MCGIAGLWLPAGRSPDLRSAVASMIGPLRHRGPDASGTWIDDQAGVALGHRRLAVVGLGHEGDQPMTSRSGRWVLSYNGELYGADRLRDRLAGHGMVFRGGSDTEVLVEALDRWDVGAALDAIDGMFAFAAWDREQHRMVLARDRMGEKPLAYARLPGGGVAFASELGALRQAPRFDSSIDPEALSLYLRFKAVPAPWTIYRGARKLESGCWLEIADPVGQCPPVRSYWSYAEALGAGAADPLEDEEEALDALHDVLAASVEAQLHADVPVGAFLSGGIDSSLVATLAAERSSHPLRTFTIGSSDPDLDEAASAHEIAVRLGSDHTELEVTPQAALAEVPALASRWDEPFGDSSQLPMLLVSQLARRSVTVALSGDGGDELFGGYNRHLWLPRTWDRLGGQPRWLRRALGWALAAPPPAAFDRVGRVLPEDRRPRMAGLKAQKLASVLLADDVAAAYLALQSHWAEPEVLTGVAAPRTLAGNPEWWPDAPSLTEKVMAVDALTFLPDDVLVKVDRAAMAVSLETRVPLLSREVVELAARLPLSLKVRGGVGKWALRELLARYHPRGLFDRPKSGLGVPIASWLRHELRPWAEDLLADVEESSGGLLQPAPIRAAWDEHLKGRRDRSYELWDVLMFLSWLESVDR